MDWSFIKDGLKILAESAPFGFVVVIFMIVATHMQKLSINTIKDAYDTSLQKIQNANDKANEQLRANMELLNKWNNQKLSDDNNQP